MRILFVAALAAILAGCTTTSPVDNAIQKNLPQVCAAAATAYLAVQEAETAGLISRATSRKVDTAWDVLEPVCKNPSETSTATILLAAITAYGTIARALREAE